MTSPVKVLKSIPFPALAVRMRAATAPSNLKSGWPKLHLIYSVLASIDVAAIFASLYIGFHMMSTFERGADRNLAFDRQSASLIAFSSAITEAQSIVVSGIGVNQEIAQLNCELQKNFSRLRDAQDELVRKGKMAHLGQLTQLKEAV